MTRWFISIVLLLSFSISLTGQTVPQPQPRPKVDENKAAEKLAKQVLIADQILADAQGLRLGENRAFVYAKVGGLIWKSDKKTAQDLFQRTIGELANVQMLAEAEEAKRSNQQDIRLIQTIRPNILTAIGSFDAELALEGLYRTRTSSIQKALAQMSEVTPAGKISDLTGGSSQLARAEFNLEQRLIRLAAEQNPERAAKLLQDSIRKGLSNETLALLKRLFQKDPEAANSLAGDTMDKLLGASFSTDPSDQGAIGLAYSILNDSLRVRKPGAKELVFEEMELRSLANKMIGYAMSAGQNLRFSGVGVPSLIKIAEKFSPGSVAALKKLEKSNQPPGMSPMVPNADSRRLLEANMTASQLIAEAKKIPAESRAPVYQSAANKMAQSGDLSGALEVLNANFSGRSLENAINSANMAYVGHLMNQGKWVEAERLIEEFPENNKRFGLINLATKSFAKDPAENKSYALSVLAKVRAMLADKPSDQTELQHFMQLTSAYAGIEVDEAFNCFEPIIPQLNELADANAIVQGFQNGMNVRSGEFMLVNGGFYGFQFDQSVIRTLAKADLVRTLKLIDGFSRREMRISLKIQLAENGLN